MPPAAADIAERVLKELALQFAAHPDYREVWRPSAYTRLGPPPTGGLS
jgi:hypothetical protein